MSKFYYDVDGELDKNRIKLATQRVFFKGRILYKLISIKAPRYRKLFIDRLSQMSLSDLNKGCINFISDRDMPEMILIFNSIGGNYSLYFTLDKLQLTEGDILTKKQLEQFIILISDCDSQVNQTNKKQSLYNTNFPLNFNSNLCEASDWCWVTKNNDIKYEEITI